MPTVTSKIIILSFTPNKIPEYKEPVRLFQDQSLIARLSFSLPNAPI